MITSQLIATGFALGIFHVLAGPDHLCALATLSVGNSWKAMALGVRWGLGHSTGLVVVAVIFISLKGNMDLGKIGQYSNSVLGVFMITIGIYGVLGGLKTYEEKRMKRDLDLPDHSNLNPQKEIITQPLLSSSLNAISTSLRTNSELSHSSRSESTTDLEGEMAKSRSIEYFGHDHDDHAYISAWLPFIDMHDSTTQKVVSCSIGILHGVAGPGAILGVLPAVEMQSWKASTCYLGSFIIASTISMGAFAALYGEITKRIGAAAESVELGLRIFSSSLSIVVGLLWLVLSLLGKLDAYFH